MLKCIEIRNFRSCRETLIPLEGSVSALIGRNGVGKTNVLKCIEWVARASLSPFSLSIDVSGWLPSSVSNELVISLVDDLPTGRFEYSIQLQCTAARDERVLLEKLRVTRDHTPSEIFSRKAGEIKISGRSEPIQTGPLMPAIPALRSLLPKRDPLAEPLSCFARSLAGTRYYELTEGPTEGFLLTEKEYQEWLTRYRATGLLTDSVLPRLVYLFREDKPAFEELQAILATSSGLGVVDKIRIWPVSAEWTRTAADAGEAGEKTPDHYVVTFRPSPSMGGSGQFFGFADLSAGTRRVIRMVTSLLFDKRSLMLIEQPEDSIHPGLLRKLVDLFRSYSDRSQVIFTTHSPEVLDILRPEEVLLTTAPGGETNVRALTPEEIERAKLFLKDEGSLSEFLEPFDELA